MNEDLLDSAAEMLQAGRVADAADVLDSFAAAWDCAHPLHVGRTNAFRGWGWIMGNINLDRCAKP